MSAGDELGNNGTQTMAAAKRRLWQVVAHFGCPRSGLTRQEKEARTDKSDRQVTARMAKAAIAWLSSIVE
jgi:hypothetical protein